MAWVAPIPKGVVSSDPAKFHPISLLSVLSKILKTHIKNVLLDHFDLCSPLSDMQWGFTSGKSLLVHFWLSQITGTEYLILHVRFVLYFLTD